MATNTAASFTNHTGNGSAGPFSISFSYLSEAEVDVTVGGVLKTITTHYTFTSGTQITFTSGNEPGNGVAVKFQRDTDVGSKKVDFVDGSVLTEVDLDNNANQLLFGIQEVIDTASVIAITSVQTAANESAQLALTTQEGDIVVRSDQNKSYVRNSGTASTMADFTELLTPTDQVLSVNGNTGAITAAQIATAVEAASDSNTFTDADHSKLNAIEASATADQTAAEIRTLVELSLIHI